ncbi:hypothetical protein BOO92_13755 [Vibrio navarrensis]|uniref:DotI/IcmL family type IV secretion protein n=1 Tax=Vibrio navarrensis TaxID=29495 RepID=UPI001866A621|nr:DotI/IcmL family type IV secretion protein [Vibrio navarrensis]HAS6100748.1 hypothetical protein [Vibrio vulnificus]EHA1127438.1 hypothetical protein [Vibrio navarrensis]MBE3657742.1 hypothetical protein [Vibrio navarrensis]MBH9739949.1 hypothetical protein [Vibrio navarrensis]HDY8121293.1 DotI/IcmL family type IV secretion protein [Vibrio vulnificus]
MNLQTPSRILLSFTIGTFAVLVSFFLLAKQAESIASMKAGHYVIPIHTSGKVSRIVPQAALNDPLFEDYEVMNFVIKAIGSNLNISFDSYHSQIEQSSAKYFTKSGWDSYSELLLNSQLLVDIFRRYQLFRVIPSRAPFVAFSGEVNGYWTWRLIYYGNVYQRSLSDVESNELLVAKIKFSIDVQRVPRGKGADAIKIIRASDWSTSWSKK